MTHARSQSLGRLDDRAAAVAVYEPRWRMGSSVTRKGAACDTICSKKQARCDRDLFFQTNSMNEGSTSATLNVRGFAGHAKSTTSHVANTTNSDKPSIDYQGHSLLMRTHSRPRASVQRDFDLAGLCAQSKCRVVKIGGLSMSVWRGHRRHAQFRLKSAVSFAWNCPSSAKRRQRGHLVVDHQNTSTATACLPLFRRDLDRSQKRKQGHCPA